MNELASNHAKVASRPDRRKETSPERGCLAETRKRRKKGMSKAENSRLCVGVDLHKT
jgi:hypothetical protein